MTPTPIRIWALLAVAGAIVGHTFFNLPFTLGSLTPTIVGALAGCAVGALLDSRLRTT